LSQCKLRDRQDRSRQEGTGVGDLGVGLSSKKPWATAAKTDASMELLLKPECKHGSRVLVLKAVVTLPSLCSRDDNDAV
jgi:hypothetical protein